MVTDESVTESTARRVGGLVTAEEMKVGKRRNREDGAMAEHPR